MIDDPWTDPTMRSESDDDGLDDWAEPVSWSMLDRSARLIAGGSIAALVITIVGIPFGAWDSTDFVLLLLLGTAIAAVSAWVDVPTPSSATAIPPAVVELAAASVAGVLAVWNLIETLFDIVDGTRGGIVGLILAVTLAIAAAAALAGALERSGGVRVVVASGDLWTRMDAAGLGLVLLGWALNLSIGLWSMSGATLSLAALTLAAVIVLVSTRIAAPIPVAWIGVVLGVFAAWLAIGLWSELTSLGETRIELSASDILAFLVYIVGLGLIIAGGILTALEQGARRPTASPRPPAAV
jgi:hypothetical protein